MGFFDFAGDIVGDILDPITGKSDALNQNKKSMESTERIAGASNQTIRDMYSTGRQDQLPFVTPSLAALPYYQSAILGGPVEYQDPRYLRMTSFDPDYQQANSQWQQNNPQPVVNGPDGKPLAPAGVQLYRTPEGGYTDKPPMLSATYNPQTNPAYQWQLDQLNKNSRRTLASLGRSNSTYGMNARNDAQMALTGNEYEKGINRLATLAGFGQGTSGNIAQSGTQAAGQTAAVNSNASNSLNNLYTQRGGLYTDYSPLAVGMDLASVGAKFLPFGG